MMSRIVASVVIGLLVAGRSVADDYVEVGKEKAGCDKSHEIRFHGVDGAVKLKPDTATKVVDLLAETSELYFFCGGDREREACSQAFDAVQAERAGNGAIVFTFYRNTKAKPPYTRVGTAKDGCHMNNVVRITGKNGDVKIPADSSELVALPASKKELFFYCGGTRERVANNESFDHVLVERAGNGAIHWTFLKKK
jgi:hypothetical protein